MGTAIPRLAAALALTVGCALLSRWWHPFDNIAHPAFDLWLTAVPGAAVRTLQATGEAAIWLAAVVLLGQNVLLVQFAARSIRWLRALRPAQSSSPASSPGNSTSVKPNWLKSRTRIG